MHAQPDRVYRGNLTSAQLAQLYPVRVARIHRGPLSYAERGQLNEFAGRIDRQWRSGTFNGLEYFHFRYPEQGASMAGFLLREGLHRLVPDSSRAPTPDEVEAEWRQIAQQRDSILAWAREKKALMDIVQTYRFERRQGAWSHAAHTAASHVVQQLDHRIADPMTYAGVCIEWAEREYRDWFWRCAPNHQVL